MSHCYILQEKSRDPVARQTLRLDIKENAWITGLVLHRGHLVVTLCDEILHVYEAASLQPSEFWVPDLKDPRYMVALTDYKNHYIVISDSGNLMLHWLNALVVDGKIKPILVRTTHLSYVPYGMCVTNSGQLVVCSYHTNRLYKYNSSGQCLGHIQLSEQVRPRFITSLSSGEGYAISDHSQVMLVTEDGAVSPLWRLRPRDLIQDDEGRILVADDEDHQVVMFDRRGHCTGQLLSHEDGIRWPTHLFLDQQTDTLYVSCDYPGRVMIYKYSSLLPSIVTKELKTHRHNLLDIYFL